MLVQTATGSFLNSTFRLYPGQEGSREIFEGESSVVITCEVVGDRAASIYVVHSMASESQCLCRLNSGETLTGGVLRATLTLDSPSAGDTVFCIAIFNPDRNNPTGTIYKSPPQVVQQNSGELFIIIFDTEWLLNYR